MEQTAERIRFYFLPGLPIAVEPQATLMSSDVAKDAHQSRLRGDSVHASHSNSRARPSALSAVVLPRLPGDQRPSSSCTGRSVISPTAWFSMGVGGFSARILPNLCTTHYGRRPPSLAHVQSERYEKSGSSGNFGNCFERPNPFQKRRLSLQKAP